MAFRLLVPPFFILLALLTAGCASFQVNPDPNPAFLSRAETQENETARVTAAVPSREEAEAIFGVPLYDKGVQPVWLKIENKGIGPLLFFHYGVDPDYFAPLEVAYLFHGGYFPSSVREMDDHFRKSHMPLEIPPGENRSGFVFTNLDEGTKMFNVDVFPSSGNLSSFPFYISVPGLRSDYQQVDFERLYPQERVTDLKNQAMLKEALEALPHCTTDASGKEEGDPLNLVFIGKREDLYRAFTRSRWDDTEVIYSRSIRRTASSFLFGSRYRYSPVSALYVFGRKQDIALQKARSSIHERNHLRFWLTPYSSNGNPVWVGQISRDIGVRFSWKTVTTHKIDPDIDEARTYLIESLLYAQSIAKIAFVKGAAPASAAKPRLNLTGDPYFTDGYRAVMWLSRDPVPDSEVVYLPW